jgi:hypothetical protein
MARSTGPVLAIGAITLFNDVIVHGKGIEEDMRVVVATALAAGGLALLERVSEPIAVGIAWIGLAAVLLVRTDPKTPAPIESFNSWYNAK